MTLTAFCQIVDPQMAVMTSGDVPGTLYRLLQFAIREAVATRTLDHILAARDTIDMELRAFVKERAAALGTELREIEVEDMIQENAATRSLPNASRLMEDKPFLPRLKQLEALEKLVEKVGRFDLHVGQGAGGLDALLRNLNSLGEAKSRTGAD